MRSATAWWRRLARRASTPGAAWCPKAPRPQVVVDVTAFSGGIEVKGTVSAPWTGICRRCATPVGGELDIPVQERFAPGSANPNEDELYPITDGTIDLQPLARDAIVLELPMAPSVPGGLSGPVPAVRGGPQ